MTDQVEASKPASEFTGWRKLLWPIHNYELKKFLPMGLMMFCILFVYTVLRDTKDAIVVNAPGSGAEALAYLKGIGVTFSAILFMIIYTKSANVFKREGLFYVTAAPFLVFFISFAYIIQPMKNVLHASPETIAGWQTAYPNIKWIIPLVGNWTYSLFYILSELWGSAVIALLFWQFANAITPTTQAKRFYGMFGFLGNFGLIFSGPLVYFMSSYPKKVLGLEGEAAWSYSLKWLMLLVLIVGIVLLYTFYWMNRNVLTDKKHYDPEAMGEKKGKKQKLSIAESFKFILSSPYLGLVAMLVLAYGVSINLFEGVWKGQIKVAFPNENDYNAVMGGLSFVTGIITVLLMLVGSNFLRRVTWRTAALITPTVLLIGSMIFFYVIFQNNKLLELGVSLKDAVKNGSVDRNTVVFAVMVGLFINAFGKGVKYSLFDPTKEMAYIPLDPELKVKGKAAVDVIGGRGGKSGGSYIQMALLYTGLELYQLIHLIAPIVIGVIVLWLMSALGLSKKYEKIVADKAGAA